MQIFGLLTKVQVKFKQKLESVNNFILYLIIMSQQ